MRTSLLEQITVKVLKYDGSDHRQWSGTVSRRDGSLLQLEAAFSTDVTHDLLGQIRQGTRLVEYYWLDRWFNVFRFLHDDGSTRLFYCNVTTPPKLEAGLLTYVDLDIDVLATPDFSYEVLDADEFEANGRLYGYSEEIKTKSQAAVDELTAMIESREFPFDS
jgi:hypothetical protein